MGKKSLVGTNQIVKMFAGGGGGGTGTPYDFFTIGYSESRIIGTDITTAVTFDTTNEHDYLLDEDNTMIFLNGGGYTNFPFLRTVFDGREFVTEIYNGSGYDTIHTCSEDGTRASFTLTSYTFGAWANGLSIRIGDTPPYFSFFMVTPITTGGVNEIKKAFWGTSAVFSKQFTLYISIINGVATQTITRTSSLIGSTGVLSHLDPLYYGDVLTISATPSPSYTNPAVTTPVTIIDGFSTSMVITAGTIKTYTVTLNKQSGTGGTSSVTAKLGLAMPSATAPSRSAYTFQGYHLGTFGAGNKYYNANMTSARNWDRTSNTTLYAYWTAKSGPYWSLSSGTYSATFTMQSYGAPGSDGALSWLTTNYPPGNYTLNHKVRVRVVDPDTYMSYGTYIFIRLQY